MIHKTDSYDHMKALKPKPSSKGMFHDDKRSNFTNNVIYWLILFLDLSSLVCPFEPNCLF